MMTRGTLHKIKAALKSDAGPPSISQTTQLLHSLVDHGLDALDELEGGQSVIEQRAALKERERQVKLALDYLEALIQTGRTGHPFYRWRTMDKAVYVVNAIREMFSARGPQWTREWSYYVPRIDEEFDA